MLTSLEAQLALVPVADSIVAADWLKFGRTGRTLADCCSPDLRAVRAPLTDLQKGNPLQFDSTRSGTPRRSLVPLSSLLFRETRAEKSEINRGPSLLRVSSFCDSDPFVDRSAGYPARFRARKADNLSLAMFYRGSCNLISGFNSRVFTVLRSAPILSGFSPASGPAYFFTEYCASRLTIVTLSREASGL